MLGRFIKYIQHGLETEIVELKAFPPPLKDDRLMGNVIKEVLAIANTGKQGFILFGVNDETRRRHGEEFVPGIVSTTSDDQVQREITAKINNYTDPVVRIRYNSYEYSGKTIGVLTVLRSGQRPHMVAKNGLCVLRRGDYLIRQGTCTEVLTPAQIRQITSRPVKKYVTLLNFSHPFTELQVKQLEERLDCLVEHIWPDCKVDFDAGKPFEPQIRALVDGLGYSPEEWQDVSKFVVSLPGLAEAAAVLLSELHGRMGQFPSIVRRCQQVSTGGVTDYTVCEVITLSEVRARARRGGAHLVTGA